MASYDDLAALTGPLKLAAIDAYMKSNNWPLQGNHYELSSTAGTATVTRPGEDGEGGGDWAHSDGLIEFFVNDGRDREFSTAFATIRSNIDTALERWQVLPDPGLIQPQIDAMREANRRLRLDADASGGFANGGGAIAGALTGIEQNSTAMSGTTIATFKQKFLFQLGTAIGGQHAITIILGGALAGQQGMWTDARQTVADIVVSTTNVFNSYAGSGGGDWTVALKVVGWALKGVGIFATGGATASISVASLGVEILQGTVGAPDDVEAPSPDFDSIMGGFTDALDQLATGITAEETLIQTNINTNIGIIRGSRDSFDLTRPAILDISDHSQADIVVINQDLVDEITLTYMPSIAEELGAAATSTMDGLNIPIFWRDSSIGVGDKGPNWDWSDLMFVLKDLLTDLQWEVQNGAKSLELAILDMELTDAGVDDDLSRHHRDVQAGSGADPWN